MRAITLLLCDYKFGQYMWGWFVSHPRCLEPWLDGRNNWGDSKSWGLQPCESILLPRLPSGLGRLESWVHPALSIAVPTRGLSMLLPSQSKAAAAQMRMFWRENLESV